MTLPSRVVASWRDALRQLRHEPAYATLMIVTLVIGIAAAAAIFAVVRGVLLRPLPYADAESIISIQEFQPLRRADQTTVATANLPRIASARSLAGLSAFNYSEYVLSDDRDAERIVGARVDEKLLTVLGVRPALGRGIANGEAGPNPARVVVLSDAIWRRRFGSDASLLGRSVTIDGAPYSVIGVMPRGFEFPRNPSMSRDVDVWVPRRPPPPMMLRRGMRDLTVIARLRSGVSTHDAQAELSTAATLAATEDAALNAGWQLRVLPLREMMVGGVRPALDMLAACVGVLLIIAGANASAGALSRMTTKRHAFGVRLALGASQTQLTASLIGESMVLAVIAAVIALPLSTVLRRLLIQIAPVALPRQGGIAVDGWTIAFAAGVALLTGLVIVVAPALWLHRLDLTTFLSESSRTATGSLRRSRVLATFVVAQLALGTVLLAATARLYSNFSRLNSVDPGFDVEHVTTATLALGGMRYQEARARTALTTQLLDRVRALPGVERAAVTSLLPMSGGLMSAGYSAVSGTSDSSNTAALRAVSSDFFTALGIPILQGRAVAATDDDRALRVAVINEALEHQAFGARSALGASIVVTPPGSDAPEEFQIVGVAGNAKEKDLLGPGTPVIYFSDRQASFPHFVLVVRSTGQYPAAAVRGALRELDPALALDDVGALGDRVRSSYALQFFLLTILSVFAVSGALLIAVGVYGSVSFTVAAELRATGVRMALGASRGRILGGVLARTGRLAALGCAIGIAAALLLPRLLNADAFLGTDAGGFATLTGAAAVLVVAVVATAVPARRASGLDPLTVLREP